MDRQRELLSPCSLWSMNFQMEHKVMMIIPLAHLLVTLWSRRAAVTSPTCKRPATWLASVSKVSPGYRLGFSSKLLGEETSSRNKAGS